MRKMILPTIGTIIGTALAWVTIPLVGNVIDLVVPTSRWLDVGGITVQDADLGESPHVSVVRTINRPFTAEWTVTLRRETPGGHATFCARHGRDDYRVDSALPSGTDLDWWMDIPSNNLPCPAIPPGRYIVTVLWTLQIPGLNPKVVRAESNTFKIAL